MAPIIRGRIIALVLIPCAAFVACNRSLDVLPPSPVQRMVSERLAAGDSPEVRVPAVDASWSTRHVQSISNTPSGMRLVWGGEPAVMSLAGSIRAEDYSAFLVRMKITPDEYPRDEVESPQAVFRWKSSLEPYGRPETERRTPVFADGEFHNYEIPLWSANGSAWLGEVSEIEFVPCSAAGDVEIEGMELSTKRPSTPVRVTIESQTHEALFGGPHRWSFRVPENAVFDTHVGVDRLSWERAAADPVTFSVKLEDESGRRVEIAREEFFALKRPRDRGWRRVMRDLSAYAGETVTVHLDVEHGETPEGDYAWWGTPSVYQEESDPLDVPVILISNDTLRADHLSCYGYERETSPGLDAFREDAVLFENAMCPVSWTLPSHMTMLTGLYPKNHRVSHTVNLREEVKTLPEYLRDADYLTAAYTGVDGYLGHSYGFPHGFDLYNTPASYRPVGLTQPLALDWLEGHARGRVFLFYHNFDIHSKAPKPDSEDPYFKLPYHNRNKSHRYFATTMPTPPLLRFENPNTPIGTPLLDAASFRRIRLDDPTNRYLEALYDDGIRYVDSVLSEFFEELRQRDIYDRALIIVTSDHGEEFFEHGRYLHYQIYEECQRIPLIVKFPRNIHAGKRFAPIVKLADILPTVLDVIGAEPPVETDGQSLLALVDEKVTPHDKAFGERDHQRVLRTRDWHLSLNTRNGSRKAERVSADGTTTPVIAAQFPELVSLERELKDFFSADRAGWNIECQGFPRHGRSEIEISTLLDAPAADAHLLQGDTGSDTNVDTLEKLNSDRETKTTLQLWGEDVDGLVIRPTGANHRMKLLIRVDRPVDIVVGGRMPRRATGMEGLLDPEEERYPRPVDVPGRLMDVPRIRIWYEKPPTELPSAAPLSEEQKQELESLGYLQH